MGRDNRQNGYFCSLCGAWKGSLGLEPTFELYIKHLIQIFDECRRILKDDGTLFVNIGDTYASGTRDNGNGYDETRWEKSKEGQNCKGWHVQPNRQLKNYQSKCLCDIPFRFSIAMIDSGWIKRNTVIWHKPNCLNGGTKLYSKTQKGVMPSTLKDLVRLEPNTVELWDGEKWNRVSQWIENKNPENIIEITLHGGEKITCTGDHRFISNGQEIMAKELLLGNILDNCILPDNNHTVDLIPDDIGWFIGLYLAEGSRGDDRKCLQFASHTKEIERYVKLKRIAEQYDATCTEHITSEKGKTINIYSNILGAIIDNYVSGETSYYKHLTNKSWRRNNQFLSYVLNGYLSGDGHYDHKNERWRIGFTRKNDYLANDIRCLCARLGHKLILRKKEKAFLGEVRFTVSAHFNTMNQYEIVQIKKGKKQGKYWDIILEQEPHLFSTIGGLLIHNCMPASCKDRFTCDFEYVFMFVKQGKYYFEQQFEPAIRAGCKNNANEQHKEYSISRCITVTDNKNKRCVWSEKARYMKLRDDLTPEQKSFVIDRLLRAGLI